jgi:hypothetical protein
MLLQPSLHFDGCEGEDRIGMMSRRGRVLPLA